MVPDNNLDTQLNPSRGKTLVHHLRQFQSRSEFRKYLYISIALFIFIEGVIGYSFNAFFSKTLEEERKQNYTNAWENYLLQRWKTDQSKITGYIWWSEIWVKVKTGNLNHLTTMFNKDLTISENYDFFSIYLNKEKKPIIRISGKDFKEIDELDPKLINKFFDLQSNKTGNIHSIVNLYSDRFFLISVSALCDDFGNPMLPGVAIFANDLEKFLKLAEQVIPVDMKIKKGKPKAGIYHYFLIPNQFGLNEDFYIEIKPEYEIQSLVINSLLFFMSVQILLSLTIFLIIVPRYAKKKTIKLERIINESEHLNTELIKKIEEIKIANLEIEKSEAKYKHLVESSQDIIFSFDRNGFILTANKALVNFLGLKREDLIGKFFLDLAYNAENKIDSLEKQLLMEKFEELKENQASVSFSMTFRTKNNEPLQLGVQWEYVKIRDSFVVFGKSFSVTEDSMLKYFESENKKYVFNNYITLAEQVSQRITSNLVKYISISEAFNIRICVREMIINSIEHGNLEIDFETKTKLRATKGEYFRFIQERQNDPKYKDRKVSVWYSLNENRVAFLIKDEGKGFDHNKILADNSETANLNFLNHGRGIFMTKNTFDKISYNKKGNRVHLLKFFK